MMNSEQKASLRDLFEIIERKLENQPKIFDISAEETYVEPDVDGFYEIYIPHKIMLIKEEDNIQNYGINGTISIYENILGFMFLRSYDDKSMSLYLKEDETATIDDTIILKLTEKEVIIEGVKDIELFYYGKTQDKKIKMIADNICTYPDKASVSYSLKDNIPQDQ